MHDVIVESRLSHTGVAFRIAIETAGIRFILGEQQVGRALAVEPALAVVLVFQTRPR